MCVGLERWALPTPKVKVDRSQAEMQGLDGRRYKRTMIEEAADQAEAFLSTELAYLVESPVIQFDSYAITPNLYSVKVLST